MPKAVINLGDCMEFMKMLKSDSMDLILTDPPYGLYGDVEAYFRKYTRINERYQLAFYGSGIDASKFLREAYRLLDKKHGVFITFFSREHVSRLISLLQNIFLDYTLRLCIYEHTISSMPGSTFRAKYDPFIVVYPKTHIKNTEELEKYTGKSYIQDVIHKTGLGNGSIKFAGQKPVEVLLPYILYFTRPGMNVFDPFMGTGSTGEAALSVGRNFYGAEIDKTVYEIARMRLMAYNTEEG